MFRGPQFFLAPKIINPELCMITFGQTKSDYNNKMLTITGEYNLEAFIQWDIWN